MVLFLIDLIIEHSHWHHSQRGQRLWQLLGKYSCCARFCHNLPVDRTQPWQAARERRKEGEVERENEGEVQYREREWVGRGVQGEVCCMPYTGLWMMILQNSLTTESSILEDTT